MSTSCSPALDPEQKNNEVRSFPYPEAVQGATAGTLAGGVGASGEDAVKNVMRAAQEASQHEQVVREEGRRQGQEQARAFYEEQLSKIRESVLLTLQDFARQRREYYERVESEVVQLALSIARKILHRESQLDPLLLAGIVRVALDKIESGTKVLVRVHPQHAADWRAYFAQYIDPRDIPEVVEDAALSPDHCVLETTLGTTELGVESQLKEIEQGLMDLLAQRPQS